MITTNKVFNSIDTPSNSGPLDRCIEWASENLQQGDDDTPVVTPMLIFNEEVARKNGAGTTRRMVATDIATFIENNDGRTSSMYFHEIVPSGAPVKLAFDVELKFATDDESVNKRQTVFGASDEATLLPLCATLTNTLVDVCLSKLSTYVGRPLDQSAVVETHCTRPGKFSRHITIDGSDDVYGSIVFATDSDCRAFVESLLANELANERPMYDVLIDLGIYDDRHPLRTYFSAKREAPSLRMRLATDGACDGTTLARSLRSCIVTHRAPASDFYHQPGTRRYVTSLYAQEEPDVVMAIRIPGAKQSRRTANSSAAGSNASAGTMPHSSALNSVASAILACPDLSTYAPQRVVFRLNVAIVKCGTLACSAHPSKAHRKDNKCVFLRVDLLTQMYVQLCHSTACKEIRRSNPPRRRPLSLAVCQTIIQYLNSADWPDGENVGVDFETAIAPTK